MQNGPLAYSNAIFIAASFEDPLAQQHNIVDNGFDLGRDLLVGNLTKNGGTSFLGVNFTTTVQNLTGLLNPGATESITTFP